MSSTGISNEIRRRIAQFCATSTLLSLTLVNQDFRAFAEFFSTNMFVFLFLKHCNSFAVFTLAQSSALMYDSSIYTARPQGTKAQFFGLLLRA
ncbi:hypothetical protein R3P38DRAFT_3242696 [Favolaschia claudopus]|uniref:CASP-like protein n=1 Tax=Favolaschia claudopus TaxID=2862362 RepID=A0AAV9Z5V6_9AGAR